MLKELIITLDVTIFPPQPLDVLPEGGVICPLKLKAFIMLPTFEIVSFTLKDISVFTERYLVPSP